MKRIGLPVLLAIVIAGFISCKSKKKDIPASDRFIPVLSFIKSQVAKVDTGLYSIKKVNLTDTSASDTMFYQRENFRQLASEFLEIPDISDPKFFDRYKEVRSYDETINRVFIVCTPIKPEREQIQKQEVIIQQGPEGDKITNIIIDYYINTKDSSLQKRMLWQADRSFQVATTRQLPGQPETITVYKVIWNEDDQE
jgi:hypothetical protein